MSRPKATATATLGSEPWGSKREAAQLARPRPIVRSPRFMVNGAGKAPPMNDDEDLVAPRGVEVPRSPGSGRDVVPFREAVRVWFAISLQTFGDPAGQIEVMQHALVDQKRWIGQRRFLHALSFWPLLPGPEAQQLAIYIGWLLNGTRGAWSPAASSCSPAWSRSWRCQQST
jgi:Chromate transporter